MLTTYQHIIWDWNGTLLDDARLCLESLNITLENRHMSPLTLAEYQEMFDFPVIDFYRKLGFDLEVVSFADLAAEYHAEYGGRWRQCQLQPGALDLLEALSVAGVTQSVLSAAHQEMLEACVDYFDLRRFFVAVVGLENNQAHGKVERGRQWMQQLEAAPHDVVLIGDTRHDFEVARAIGADCKLVVSGHHRREKLETCPTEVFDNLTEVFNHRSPCDG